MARTPAFKAQSEKKRIVASGQQSGREPSPTPAAATSIGAPLLSSDSVAVGDHSRKFHSFEIKHRNGNANTAAKHKTSTNMQGKLPKRKELPMKKSNGSSKGASTSNSIRREVAVNTYTGRASQQRQPFIGNRVTTAQYELWNFVPLNFMHQFRKPANWYFLFLACLQLYPETTISNGYPTYIPPLVFVISVSMLKDFMEDRSRHAADREENMKVAKVLLHDGVTYEEKLWEDIQVKKEHAQRVISVF